MLLRYFVHHEMVTRFIELPTAKAGIVAAFFGKIDDCVVIAMVKLQYQHLVYFNSNTCNTMKVKGMM